MEFCQSCAMPLENDTQRGTEANGAASADYCAYCYKEGAFTADVSMEEMIELCAGPMAEANPDMSADEAKAKMREFFPQLRRWAK